MSLKLRYWDKHLVVIDKPHELLSVPAKDVTLPNAYQQLAQLFNQTIHVVHRLDMSTSGLMVFAFDKTTLVALQKQFRLRTVDKVYECLVINTPKGSSGVINAPLLVDWPNRPKQKVNYLDGKKALTRWRKLSESNDFSRLELHPHTGRSHQLRVHMMHTGHAIIGDELYTPKNHQKGRLMLHAKTLSFIHPYRRTGVSFQSPAPF